VRRILRLVRRRIGALWQGLRVLSGDAAWETYVRRCQGHPELDRKQFYLERMQHKYRRPCRCC
jgi:hypothetical protein